MNRTIGYAAHSSTTPLESFPFDRREPGPSDVEIDIQYCGVCHSDLHTARNEWTMTVYPVVPGHEIVGRVSRVGGGVTRFDAGDVVGVGCMVDSCGTCPDCADGLEQYCQSFPILTYNSPDRHTGGMTYGGYSKRIVVDEKFVLRIPTNLSLAAAAPLLCAGITTYSPLRHWGVTAREEGRHRRTGRTGAHGPEVRPRAGRPHGPVHDVSRQGGRRAPAGRRRGGGVREPGRDEAPRWQLRLHPRHGRGPARPGCADRAAEARRHAVPGGGAGRGASVSGRLQPDLQAAADRRARSSGGSARRRRCSTSAESTASRRTSR